MKSITDKIRKKSNTEQADSVVLHYKKGFTIQDCADLEKISWWSAYCILRKRNVPRRPRGTNPRFRDRQKSFTKHLKDKIIELAKKGYTQAEAAKAIGCTISYISKLKARDKTFKPSFKCNERKAYRKTCKARNDKRVARVKILLKEGKSLTQIAKDIGVVPQTVATYCKRYRLVHPRQRKAWAKKNERRKRCSTQSKSTVPKEKLKKKSLNTKPAGFTGGALKTSIFSQNPIW